MYILCAQSVYNNTTARAHTQSCNDWLFLFVCVCVGTNSIMPKGVINIVKVNSAIRLQELRNITNVHYEITRLISANLNDFTRF
jgi:hypothetical protein